jgi:plastocyanin
MISRMKTSRAFVALLFVTAPLLLGIGLTACSFAHASAPTPPADFTPRPTPGGGANHVEVTAMDFAEHKLTVSRGTIVTFVVRLDSGPHILCLGKNGLCDPSLPGPPELRQDGGFSVDAGQSLALDFVSPGIYPITCAIYPSMNIVITVT